MSNKNQRRLKNSLRKASKAGQNELAVEVPAPAWHSKPSYQTRRIPAAKLGAGGVNSKNTARNMQQKVFRNEGAGAGSVTAHVPIDASRPVQFKNKGYMHSDENKKSHYRQPSNIRS